MLYRACDCFWSPCDCFMRIAIKEGNMTQTEIDKFINSKRKNKKIGLRMNSDLYNFLKSKNIKLQECFDEGLKHYLQINSNFNKKLNEWVKAETLVDSIIKKD